jgi:hypothetical protein
MDTGSYGQRLSLDLDPPPQNRKEDDRSISANHMGIHMEPVNKKYMKMKMKTKMKMKMKYEI